MGGVGQGPFSMGLLMVGVGHKEIEQVHQWPATQQDQERAVAHILVLCFVFKL